MNIAPEAVPVQNTPVETTPVGFSPVVISPSTSPVIAVQPVPTVPESGSGFHKISIEPASVESTPTPVKV